MRSETAAVPVTLTGAASVQRGFFSGPCVAEHWNLAAAIASLVAAAGAAIGLIVAPDPTTITKWAAIGAIAGVIAGIAWTINGILALRGCLSADADGNRREIQDLERRLHQLEEAQRRIQQFQQSAPAPDASAPQDAGSAPANPTDAGAAGDASGS